MDIPSLNLTTWAGLAAAGALLATFWRNAIGILNRIADLIFGRVVLKDEAARAMMRHVWAKGRKSPFGLRSFGGVISYVAPKQRVEIVGYEGMTSEPLLFWFGLAPMLVSSGQNMGNGSGEPNLGHLATSAMPVIIRYIRGTLDIDALIEGAVRSYNEIRQHGESDDQIKPKRFNVIRMASASYGLEVDGKLSSNKNPIPSGCGYSGDSSDIVAQIKRGELRLLTWKADDLVERSNTNAPFSSHPIPEALMNEFAEIGTWLKSEQWFRSKGVPWSRGYLLHSKPGAGKDTLIRNLAILHDLPVYTFDLSTYDNSSFVKDWKSIQQNAPVIALMSDIDAVFDGRENLAVKGKNRDGLTFDCLLNTLSGVGQSDGVLLFITTNHIESLDPALGNPVNGDSRSTRPGRIDKVIHMGPMGEPERRKVAELILGDWPELVEPTVAAGDGEMAAQFQERCVQIAEKRFWA